MKLDDIVELLLGVPLFSGLSNKQLAWVALSGEPVIFVDNQEIITDDEPGDAAYLILSGEAKRSGGSCLDEDAPAFGAGTFIGEMAMLVETDYSSTVEAIGSVRALKFRREVIRTLMEREPVLAEHFSEKVTDRFLSFVGALKAFRNQFDMPESAGVRSSPES